MNFAESRPAYSRYERKSRPLIFESALIVLVLGLGIGLYMNLVIPKDDELVQGFKIKNVAPVAKTTSY
ncbi:MAG: hypothetical protein ACOYNL_06295 [Rickettsiales bacterium]